MKIVLQQVSKASIEIEAAAAASISFGFVLLIGVEKGDSSEDADLLIDKILNLRTFENPANGKSFDFSLLDVKGDSLLVSQFTIPGSFLKGRRPDFSNAMAVNEAKVLYDYFVDSYKNKVGNLLVQTGEFGANMSVGLVNEGPITYILNSNDFKKA
jgi:D-tyrosyl-tRNA(Tyr) deacylase